MKLAIVRYNAGNTRSVIHAFERLGVEPIVTDDPELLLSADRVVFPGQGEASSAMAYLQDRGLDQILLSLKQPVLGICLGLHLMCAHTEENDTACLGTFTERVRLFPPSEKVPHMGWNTIGGLRGPLFRGLDEGAHVYFVHSYYAEVGPDTTATTEYILPFSAGLSLGNVHTVQFHPEKSGPVGARILENFLAIE